MNGNSFTSVHFPNNPIRIVLRQDANEICSYYYVRVRGQGSERGVGVGMGGPILLRPPYRPARLLLRGRRYRDEEGRSVVIIVRVAIHDVL